jgi:hypothetical protein
MTPPLPAAAPVLTSSLIDEGRWNEWKARGRADRRETAARMKIVAALVAVGLAAWVTRAILTIP